MTDDEDDGPVRRLEGREEHTEDSAPGGGYRVGGGRASGWLSNRRWEYDLARYVIREGLTIRLLFS